MKHILLILVISLFSYVSSGQCTSFHRMKSGAKTEMTHYDKKGKLFSISRSEVLEQLTTSNGYEADIRTKVIDEDGEEIFSGDVMMKCENNMVIVSMQHILGPDQLKSFQDMEVKVEETNIYYPFDINSTTVLKDGNFKAQIYSGEMKIMTLNFEITGRKVLGQEKVTTSAGTFDCVKIGYQSKVKALFSFISPKSKTAPIQNRKLHRLVSNPSVHYTHNCVDRFTVNAD
jgi:hypothetical protein